MLQAEGERIRDAARDARALTESSNRYKKMPVGGDPGSPVRLRAAAEVVWSFAPEARARRAERRQEALKALAAKKALTPRCECGCFCHWHTPPPPQLCCLLCPP